MRDVFPSDTAEGSGVVEPVVGDSDSARIRESIEGQVACPFCGAISDGSQAVCAKCTMENTAVARKATKLRIGPWYVLQNRNPAAPGMKWDTLLTFIKKGRVRPHSVVRGPTTHQLWRFAAHVKGLSREFGVCYSCGGSVERGGNVCPHCNRLQEPPTQPDSLLESEEQETKFPIYKEISSAEVEQHNSALIDDTSSEAVLEAQRKIREQEETLAREQRAAVERDRQAVEAEKQAAAHDREVAKMEHEAVAREREALARAKESLEKDRSALAREREAARHDRDAAAIAAREATNARDAASREVAAARELTARQAAAEKEQAIARETTAARELTATQQAAASSAIGSAPIHEVVSAPESAVPALAEPANSVWDLGDQESQKHSSSPTQGRRTGPAAPAVAVSAGAALGQKSRARDGFLSAKDLAAAFKLTATAEEYDVSAKPAEAHRQPAPVVSPSFPADLVTNPPRRGFGKLVAVILLLGVGAAVALVPDLRQMAVSYWLDLTDQTPKHPAHADSAAPRHKDDLPDDPKDFHPDAQIVITPPLASTRPTTTAIDPSDVQPLPTPVISPPPPSVPSPTPEVVLPAPTVLTTVAPPAATQPAGPASIIPPLPPADAATRAQSLYHSAIDAEGRVDFSAAVGFLEQLEKLPRNVWPSDVDMRLQHDRVQQNQK